MIYINNRNILEELKNKNNYCVIIDFDRTLTTGASDASLGIIPQFLGGECLKERLKNYGDYEFFKNIQVLTPTKKGKIGTKELNKSLQQELNPMNENILEKT